MTQEAAPSSPVGAPAPKKKSRLKKLVKWAFVLFVLLVVVLAALPAVASSTFLTGTVRGQLKKQFGEGADVGADIHHDPGWPGDSPDAVDIGHPDFVQDVGIDLTAKLEGHLNVAFLVGASWRS